jgi:hypothetical protein
LEIVPNDRETGKRGEGAAAEVGRQKAEDERQRGGDFEFLILD